MNMAYEIGVNEKELKGEIYERFIKEAIRRSDTVRIKIYWPAEGNYKASPLDSIESFSEEMLLKITGHTKKEIYEREKIYEQEFYTEREEFWKETAPFLEALEPYKIYECNEETKYYRVCAEMEPLLLQPGAIMRWRYPYFPDSPCFYKDKTLWFGTVIDEEAVAIYTKTKEEAEYWIDFGIPYYNVKEVKFDEDGYVVCDDQNLLNQQE